MVVADQAVKLIIANYFIDTRFDIIESVLGFRPIFNNKYSYFNDLLKLNLGILPHTVLLVFIQFGLILLYGYFKVIKHSTVLINIAFIFGQAALICVFCGFFLWKDGILDFIFLYPFTCDLKDIYLNCFVVLFLWDYFNNYTEFKNSNLKFRNYSKRCWVELKQFAQKKQ